MLDPNAFANLSSHGFLHDISGLFWDTWEEGPDSLGKGRANIQTSETLPWDYSSSKALWEHFYLLQTGF